MTDKAVLNEIWIKELYDHRINITTTPSYDTIIHNLHLIYPNDFEQGYVNDRNYLGIRNLLLNGLGYSIYDNISEALDDLQRYTYKELLVLDFNTILVDEIEDNSEIFIKSITKAFRFPRWFMIKDSILNNRFKKLMKMTIEDYFNAKEYSAHKNDIQKLLVNKYVFIRTIDMYINSLK